MVNVLHSSLTSTDLHEPKGIAGQASGKVYVSNGANSGVWTTLPQPAFMQKHIAGLTWENALDVTNDITVLAGSARDSTNTTDMVLPSSITKKLDVTWAVGNDQGGRDPFDGVLANGTYHIYLIKSTGGVVDVFFSSSVTPTLPSTYTVKRRIGSFSRVGGAIQTVSVQEVSGGGIEVLITPVETGSRVSSPTGLLNGITGLPSGIKVEAFGTFLSSTTTSNTESMIYVSPDVTVPSLLGTLTQTSGGSKINSPDAGGDNITTAVGGSFRVRCNTSAQLKIAAANSSNSTATLFGWVDYRRD